MFFTRTQRYLSCTPKEDVIRQLIGKHVKIHNMDFEVIEKNDTLRIIPHAEQEENIKTLPITQVELRQAGDKTDVLITSRIRKLDVGGPQVILIFCLFMFLISFVLMYVGRQAQITYTMLGISVLVFGIFYARMQMGYFDYVRKVQGYVKSKLQLDEAGHPAMG